MAEANKVVELKPRETEKAAPKKASAKKAAPKKATSKKTKSKAAPKPAAKKAAAKKPVAKKAAPKKAAAKKPAAAKTTAKTVKTAAKQSTKVTKTAQKAAKKVTKKATPKKAVKKAVANTKTAQKSAKKTVKKAIKATAKAAKPKTVTPAAQFTVPQFKIPFNPQPLEAIMTQPNFEKTTAQFDQITKEAANLNREGVDAFVKSGTIIAKGFENMMKETISFTQAAAEKQMQLAKKAMTSKTINEFSDAQNKLAQISFDDFMSGATKFSEMGVKIFSEAVEPINEQIQKSVQKATDAVAAE